MAIFSYSSKVPYEQGQEACERGAMADLNPYKATAFTGQGFNDQRKEWFDGFYHTQLTRTHGPLGLTPHHRFRQKIH